MPLKPLGVRGTVAGHRLGAPKGRGGGGTSLPFTASLDRGTFPLGRGGALCISRGLPPPRASKQVLVSLLDSGDPAGPADAAAAPPAPPSPSGAAAPAQDPGLFLDAVLAVLVFTTAGNLDCRRHFAEALGGYRCLGRCLMGGGAPRARALPALQCLTDVMTQRAMVPGYLDVLSQRMGLADGDPARHSQHVTVRDSGLRVPRRPYVHDFEAACLLVGELRGLPEALQREALQVLTDCTAASPANVAQLSGACGTVQVWGCAFWGGGACVWAGGGRFLLEVGPAGKGGGG